MLVNFFVDNLKVVDSGVIIVNEKETLKFELPQNGLKYQVVFLKDEKSEKIGMNLVLSNDKKSLIIEVTNSHLGPNVGNNSPLEIGVIGNSKLYIQFRISYLIESEQYFFNYRLVLKDE